MMTIFQIIIAVMIIQAILYLWIVSWIFNVSRDPKCKCAKNWRRVYILVYPMLSFLAMILLMTRLHAGAFAHISGLLVVPLFVGWILFYVFAIQYISGLKRQNCDCAIKDKSGDNVLIAYSVIHMSVIIIAFISMILYISMFSFANRITQ